MNSCTIHNTRLRNNYSMAIIIIVNEVSFCRKSTLPAAIDVPEGVVYVNISPVCMIFDVVFSYAKSREFKRVRRTGVKRNAMHVIGVYAIQPAALFYFVPSYPRRVAT